MFSRFACAVAHAAGTPAAFLLALSVVAVWAVAGPYLGYSEPWQLVINTSTTIVTFLMVFILQNSQNRDSAAVQAKLDELIRSSDARNDFLGIDKLSEPEIEEKRRRTEH